MREKPVSAKTRTQGQSNEIPAEEKSLFLALLERYLLFHPENLHVNKESSGNLTKRLAFSLVRKNFSDSSSRVFEMKSRPDHVWTPEMTSACETRCELQEGGGHIPKAASADLRADAAKCSVSRRNCSQWQGCNFQ